ncbi:MAG TPA: hypothetical protein VGH01_05310 [Jatrophihabitantaceae bacterium]|jgi:hypothetical protein
MAFDGKVDPLAAAITLIYKHGHRVDAGSKVKSTVGHERPDLKHPRLNDDEAWSTAERSMKYASAHVTKSSFDRKRKVTNVEGTGAKAASNYANKHKLAMTLGLMTRVPFGFEADVYTLNWKRFDEVLGEEEAALSRTYDLMKVSLADEQEAKGNKIDASRYRGQIIAAENRLREIKGVITHLLEERRKHEGKVYFKHFRWHESSGHGRMRQGGAENVMVKVTFDMTAHKPNNEPGVTVDVTWDERAPARGRRETGQLVFENGGKKVHSSGPIGDVAKKFAEVQPADTSKAYPTKATAALRKRIEALPAWRHVNDSSLKPNADVHRASKPHARRASKPHAAA